MLSERSSFGQRCAIAELVRPQLVRQRQPVGADPEADIVADRARHSAPADRRVALVGMAAGAEARRHCRRAAVGIAEDSQVADREVRRADMAVDVADEARAHRLRRARNRRSAGRGAAVRCARPPSNAVRLATPASVNSV